MSELVLSVRNLSVSLASGSSAEKLVDRVSFELHAGEILGLVGESGCGKSMLAAALMRLTPAPATQVISEYVRLGGTDLSLLDEPAMRQVRGACISMVFQEPMTALDPVFTIGNQLSTVIRRHLALDRKSARITSVELLKSVHITDADRIMNNYPHQLSGGMRQRVMIAMAMACKPAVLIADEPTTALDVTTQAQVLEQMAELGRKMGTAILLITHDLGVVAQYCDRALVMYRGRIVEDAAVSQLFTHPAHPYTAGLLAAVPQVSRGNVQRVQAIPGAIPQSGRDESGCRFSDRCSRSDGRCQDQAPELVPIKDSQPGLLHRLACHHPLSHNGTG